MNITYAPREILQIDDAKIIFRNFAGEKSKFNRDGDRNFAVVIPDQETADKLIDMGWNVKIKSAREEGEDPFMYLPVKVKFNDHGPIICLTTGSRRIKLEEDMVSMLDHIDILNVDLDIRPYDWVVQEGTPDEKFGRTAYLKGMNVTQKYDRFAELLAEEEFPED
ncbi:MAG: hypothetical protein NC215_00385 [Ruminococcus sp.]|nr:hypothetical protein [Ruminococcus sp.]